MSKAPTILITAGEASGDRLGGALMKALRAIYPKAKFIGVGGADMQFQGLKPLFPMADLAVMGLLEVIPAIPRILRRIRQLKRLAQEQTPDLVITIDNQDFSKRLAKALKSSSSNYAHPVPHIHYVAPKVWAWRQGRAKKLKNYYTHLLTVLPFEEKFFTNTGVPATYVGHPATSYFTNTQRQSTQTVLALLPGSRRSEVVRHWPLFLQTYRNLRQQMPELTAMLVLATESHRELCEQIEPWNASDAIDVVVGEARFSALYNASAALSKSGTNNLELALLGIPSVVTYKMNPVTYWLAKRLVKVPFISLPNLILHYAGQKPAYPEYIQHEANLPHLTETLLPLLQNKPAATAQRTRLKALQTLLRTPKPPALMAAQVISNYLK